MKVVLLTFRRLLPLLPTNARRFIWGYIVGTSIIALFDIVTLGLLAVALSDMIAKRTIALPFIGSIPTSDDILLLLVISAAIIVKSMIAAGVQWVATRRFATYELAIGDQLFTAYIRAPWTDRLQKNTTQLVRMADVGIANTVSGFLLPVIGLPNLIFTSLAVFGVVIVAQPLTALVTVVYFGGLSALMALGFSRRTVQAGRVNKNFGAKVVSLMTDMVTALKEITLRNKSGEVAAVVHSNRVRSTRARANINFLNSLPKFVLDSGLVGGLVLVGAVGYLAAGISGALAAAALFGVAGFRLAPTLVSFQGTLTTVTSNVPHAEGVIDNITESRGYIEHAEHVGKEPIVGNPRRLVFRNVSFSYPGAPTPAVRSIDLDLPMGSTLGLVGSSGAGKTTLVDLLLGLLVPSEGVIELDGKPLGDVLAAWRERVGYVPQEVAIFDGTIAQNVALTWSDDFDPERVETALKRAQLLSFATAQPKGINSTVGERGMALSGGQRQRLGIARALYGDPLILVMDEATSALDTKTESDVVKAIRDLRGEVTVVSVAHRLATIRDNDQVCFLRDGRIVESGTFDHLLAVVPDFAVQAGLAGLAGGDRKGAA
ncbi:MAG TPA: ABC transporter ATP-binding protein/permease [Galbitalea sp.]|jgi:ABC-type multidrug transport system fused ATPase/permease subunit|nr:ABC transporter ATP-binding protein/permease [Galbitalea sp.]